MARNLAHYGVKGMRWGVRKQPAVLSEDAQRHRANQKKSVGELSDRELQQLVSRLAQERQATASRSSRYTRGKKATQEILALGATVNALIALKKTPAGSLLFDRAASYIANAINIPIDSIGKTG